jgi:DeoR family galactitol utilization operon repressor
MLPECVPAMMSFRAGGADEVETMSLFENITADAPRLSKSFRRIADYIEQEREGFMNRTVRELALATGVSEPTLIRFCRHYGCSGVPEFRIALAMSLAERNAADRAQIFEPLIEDKNVVNRAAKRAIARCAAELAGSDQRIILDSGSTMQMMAEELREGSQHTIILPGGTFRSESMSLVGRMVETSLSTMHFDTAYIGSDSIDPVIGLSTFNEDEAHQNLAMIAASERVVVLADASKFSSPALHRICGLDKVHTIVTDTRLPRQTRDLIQDMGLELICADPSPEGNG